MSASAPIVSTQIAAPAADGRLIVRERLRARLDEAAARRLVHVAAPAGYGKTSLVAEWLAAQRAGGTRTAWVSLNEEHDDAGTLLRYVVAALRTAWPGVGEATLTLLNSGVPVTGSALVTTLVNELAAVTADTVLVLDDLHSLADADAVAACRELVTNAAAALHFVTTSREPPPFPVGRLRERGELGEIGADDLEFSTEEIGRFLEREAIDLAPDERAALARNTGGWAAGLRLAAIALRTEPERGRFIESFSGGHAAIGEFLQEDVLARQPEALRQFLTCAGLLGEVSAAQCDAVLERNDSRAMLELAHEKGLFTFSVDAERERFRFHHLFADFLARRLERGAPDLAHRIHLRASEWHETQGEARRAIHHALAADDGQRAAHLLETFSEELFAQGRLELLTGYARRLPDALRRRCPRLQLDLVWIHTLNWEIRAAERRLGEVRAFVEETYGDAPPAALAEKILHREIMIALLRDRLDESEALWSRWPSVSTGEDDYFEGSAETVTMITHRERFDVRFVLASAPRVRRLFVDAGTPFGTVWFDSIVGPAHWLAGAPDDAAAILAGAAATAARVSGEGSPLVAMPSLLLAAVELDRCAFDRARALVERWLPLADRIGFVDQLIEGYLCAARLAERDGDDAAVFAHLQAGDALAAEYGFERLAAHLACERVRQLLRLGRTDEARDVLSSVAAVAARPLGPPAAGASRADAAVVLARAQAADEAGLPEVVRVLRAWVAFVEGRGCTREILRQRAALAAVQQRLGRPRDAWRTLRPALGLAASSGLVWPLLESGGALLPVLDAAEATDALAADPLGEHVARLRALVAGAVPTLEDVARRPPPTAAGAVHLTPRQREILAAIADGSSNKEVGARLGLSEATVKWHLQHAYDALGVHRRVAAVRRARALGLIA